MSLPRGARLVPVFYKCPQCPKPIKWPTSATPENWPWCTKHGKKMIRVKRQ